MPGRYSNVATAPITFFASAGSCMPASSTTMWSVALLLDQRLGDAQRVDAVAQRAEVLLDGAAREVTQLLRLDHHVQHEAVAGAGAVGDVQVGVFVGDGVGGRGTVRPPSAGSPKCRCPRRLRATDS